MKNLINSYYKGFAFIGSYNLSPYKLYGLFIFTLLIISLFTISDVYAGNTSSGALDKAYDETKNWVNDLFRFAGLASLVILVINIVSKFNSIVFFSSLTVGLISMFGVGVMEHMTGALI